MCSKGPTRSAGVRRPLPPGKGSRRMTSSPQPCPTCAAPHEICCVAEIMQHQTHSRSPLTHEDMLGRHRSEAGFISSFLPASSPSAETPGLTSRSARSYRELTRVHTVYTVCTHNDDHTVSMAARAARATYGRLGRDVVRRQGRNARAISARRSYARATRPGSVRLLPCSH